MQYKSWKWQGALALMVGMAGVLLCAVPVMAAGVCAPNAPTANNPWWPNVQVNDVCSDTQSYPAAAVISGNPHAVWLDGRRGADYPDLYHAKSTIYGTVWSASTLITPAIESQPPDLAYASQTRFLHTLWVGRVIDGTAVWHARSDDAGATWSQGVKVSAALSQSVTDPALAVYTDHVYAVWSDDRTGTNDSNIYFAASTDGGATWGKNVRVNDWITGTQVAPDIAVDGRGVIHVAWEDHRGALPQIYYARSTDGGATWSTAVRLNDSESGSQFAPALATLGARVYALWASQVISTTLVEHIMFDTSANQGLTWGKDRVVDDVSDGSGSRDQAALAVAPGGILHAAWQDARVDRSTDIYYARSDDAGATWSVNVPVNDDDVSASHSWPTVTADADGAYIVWQDGRYSANCGYEIFAASWPTLKTVVIHGPTQAQTGMTVTLTAILSPALPIQATYSWWPQPLTGQGTATAQYRWQDPWPYTIKVTASNWSEEVSDTHQVAVISPVTPTGVLPVFRINVPLVTTQTALSLAGQLEGLGVSEVDSDTTHAGTHRVIIGDSKTGRILEQLGASGGLFASDPTLAFSETAHGPFDPSGARGLACEFLQSNGWFPNEASPQAQDCADPNNLPYEVTIGYSTSALNTRGISQQVLAQAAHKAAQQIAIRVQVPLRLNLVAFNPQPEPPADFVPLAGPGGHLSLIFITSDPNSETPSLDTSVPGLAALAMPWFGRSLEPVGQYAMVTQAQAIEQARARIQSSMPHTAQINAGEPELVYYVGDAAQVQQNLLPMYLFEDATATISGTEIAVRSFTVPAVEGFLPVPDITAPASNSLFTPGQPVTFTATLAEGLAPYTYTWALEDGTVLGTGTTSGNSLMLVTTALAAVTKEGQSGEIAVNLSVTDARGSQGQDAVALQPRSVYAIYLPLVLKVNAQQIQMVRIPNAPQATYRVGVEWVADYPPLGAGGSDIPNTQPDGNGFYDSLGNYGWTKTFRWTGTGAWERDWRDHTLGGSDNTYGVDRVDFMYFSGHGSPTSIYFSSVHDYGGFWGATGRFSTIRWASFSSCQTTNVSKVSEWFDAFQGAHMLLGFQSNMADIAFGGPFAQNLKPYFYGILQRPIREAWVKTAFDMGAGNPSYIYTVGTNGVNPVDNRLPKSGDPALARPFPVASWNWVWWE